MVGISHHIVGSELASLLKRMNATDPGLVIQLHVDTSRSVLSAFDDGRLDAAIVLRHDAKRRDGDVLFEEPFGWMAAPDFHRAPGEPLRLGDAGRAVQRARDGGRGARRGRHCLDRSVRRRRACDDRGGDFGRPGGRRAGAPGGAGGYHRPWAAAWPAATAEPRRRALLTTVGRTDPAGAAHPRRSLRRRTRLEPSSFGQAASGAPEHVADDQRRCRRLGRGSRTGDRIAGLLCVERQPPRAGRQARARYRATSRQLRPTRPDTRSMSGARSDW